MVVLYCGKIKVIYLTFGVKEMIELSNFIKNESETTEKYICYSLRQKIQIFNCQLQDDADCSIYVANNLDIDSMGNKLKSYIDELNNCSEKLTSYYEKEINEEVYDNWFNDIEVFSIEIIFNSIDDYGATIICGDQILQDHTLEIYFDKNEIEQIILIG